MHEMRTIVTDDGTVCLSVCPSVRQSVRQSVSLSVSPSVCPSVCQSVRQSVCHTAQHGGACSVSGVIRCSFCQITLASCFHLYCLYMCVMLQLGEVME